MKIKIEELANWGSPKIVPTRYGEKEVRKAKPGADFWSLWKENKEALKSSGISVSKFNGQWEVSWWKTATNVEQAKKDLQELQNIQEGNATLTTEQEERFQKIKSALLDYQHDSVRRLVRSMDQYKGALDSSDTGTGKTYVAIAACYVLNRSIFVICPKAVIPSWKRAGNHFGVEVNAVNYETIRTGKMAELSRISKEDKKDEFQWNLPKQTVIVFDECHRLKDYKTLNCEMGMSALLQQYTVLGISATAADNPMQMKFIGLLTKCYSHPKGFMNWMFKNGVEKGNWGLEFVGGVQSLNGIHRQIFPLHGTRIKIADLGDAFPETQISAECYDTNGNSQLIQKAYDEMESEIARLKERMDQDSMDTQALILVEMLRARQKAEILKVPAMATMIQDQVDSGMAVAVFVNFNETVDALAKKLGTDCVIRGGQSAKVREANIQRFQTDESPIIICNIRAGGVGVSLHGSPNAKMRFALICPTWSGQDLKQALGRVWRANGAKSIQRIFFASGTIEESICQNVNDKIKRIDTLNDGDLTIGSDRHLNMDDLQTIIDEAQIDEIELTLPEPDETAKEPNETAKEPNVNRMPKTERDEKIKRIMENMTPEIKQLAHDGLKQLAEMDVDRARYKNNLGFNVMDGRIGHSLAYSDELTNKQAAIASMLCNKYHRQLGSRYEPVFQIVKK